MTIVLIMRCYVISLGFKNIFSISFVKFKNSIKWYALFGVVAFVVLVICENIFLGIHCVCYMGSCPVCSLVCVWS